MKGILLRLFVQILVGVIFWGTCYAQTNDEATAAMDIAREMYLAGEYQRSISQLKQALSSVQDKMVANILQFFPKPFGPWEEMDTKTDSKQLSLSRHVSVKKLYYHKNTSASIEIEMALDATKAANLRAWIANPIELRRSSQGAELISIKGRGCIEKYDKDTRNGNVRLVLGSGIYVQVTGDGIKNMDDVRKFTELLDFETIESKVK